MGAPRLAHLGLPHVTASCCRIQSSIALIVNVLCPLLMQRPLSVAYRRLANRPTTSVHRPTMAIARSGRPPRPSTSLRCSGAQRAAPWLLALALVVSQLAVFAGRSQSLFPQDCKPSEHSMHNMLGNNIPPHQCITQSDVRSRCLSQEGLACRTTLLGDSSHPMSPFKGQVPSLLALPVQSTNTDAKGAARVRTRHCSMLFY